jgi:hypothetical protein
MAPERKEPVWSNPAIQLMELVRAVLYYFKLLVQALEEPPSIDIHGVHTQVKLFRFFAGIARRTGTVEPLKMTKKKTALIYLNPAGI